MCFFMHKIHYLVDAVNRLSSLTRLLMAGPRKGGKPDTAEPQKGAKPRLSNLGIALPRTGHLALNLDGIFNA